MAEKIAFEKGWISNFEVLVALTLTLDCVIPHTIVHHSSTSTYMPNFIEIKKNCLWTDGRTDGRTYVCMDGRTFETGFIRSTLCTLR